MIASAIAYFLTALFFAVGVYGFYRIGSDQIQAEKETTYMVTSFLFIAVAWGFAHLGGI